MGRRGPSNTLDLSVRKVLLAARIVAQLSLLALHGGLTVKRSLHDILTSRFYDGNIWAHLRDEEKYSDSVQSQRNADEPEAKLPGQVLDHITADERSSVTTVR